MVGYERDRLIARSKAEMTDRMHPDTCVHALGR
jgi:hypothetical protein